VTSWNIHPIAAHALKVVAFDERRGVTPSIGRGRVDPNTRRPLLAVWACL
jgi:hypothetical protein